MPTYEYACTSCAHEWEFEQSIKDAPLTECPACHASTARRQISRGTGFILKGSGWYSDLYSSASNKPPAKSDSADSKASETKPADTSGTKSDSGSGNSGGSSSSGSASGGSSSSSGSTSSAKSSVSSSATA